MGTQKPVVGILANLLTMEGAPAPGLERVYVNLDYPRAVALAGAVPVLLPCVTGSEDIRAQLQRVDGVLLTGGADVSPLAYGEEPHRDLGEVCPEVDEYQLEAARIATELGKPMLGICRGMQVLNVAFGGTLHQDLDGQGAGTLQHVQKSPRQVVTHHVDLDPDSRLGRIFGSATILANSLHHQAVKDLAPGFRVSAKARDGVIEGIERVAGVFTLGVQWHPEALAARQPAMLELFKAFALVTGRMGD